MNWAAVGVVGSLIVSFAGSLFVYLQARKADRSATVTKTIELGVTGLIDQYQEANKSLHDEVTECRNECRMLQDENRQLTEQVEVLKTRIDDHEAEIIRLQRKAGEIA